MLIRNRMMRNSVTVTPQDTLATAQEKMTVVRFRHLPVVQDGALVGILTDRDVHRYVGVQEQTRVVAAMTEHPLTVSPLTTVEDATQLLLKHQISGLPVLEDGKLVGIITTSDLLLAFLAVLGASAEGSVRIDVLQEEGKTGLHAATKLVNELGGEVLGVDSRRIPWEDKQVFYLRMRGADPAAVIAGLQRRGYTVLGVH